MTYAHVSVADGLTGLDLQTCAQFDKEIAISTTAINRKLTIAIKINASNYLSVNYVSIELK